jgi:soluble lytic murein transglycosylase
VKWWLTLVALVFLLAAGVIAYIVQEMRREHLFDAQIVSAAQRYKVEPALVKAVVWRESSFTPDARGKAGEIGLMQLRDLAAQEWADAEKIKTFSHEHCLDPSTNILAGSYYLGKLLRRYTHTDNAVPYALADYNAGRSYVIRWNTNSAATNSAAFIEQIAFPGTKEYVKTVMQRMEYYRPQFADSKASH